MSAKQQCSLLVPEAPRGHAIKMTTVIECEALDLKITVLADKAIIVRPRHRVAGFIDLLKISYAAWCTPPVDFFKKALILGELTIVIKGEIHMVAFPPFHHLAVHLVPIESSDQKQPTMEELAVEVRQLRLTMDRLTVSVDEVMKVSGEEVFKFMKMYYPGFVSQVRTFPEAMISAIEMIGGKVDEATRMNLVATYSLIRDNQLDLTLDPHQYISSSVSKLFFSMRFGVDTRVQHHGKQFLKNTRCRLRLDHIGQWSIKVNLPTIIMTSLETILQVPIGQSVELNRGDFVFSISPHTTGVKQTHNLIVRFDASHVKLGQLPAYQVSDVEIVDFDKWW